MERGVKNYIIKMYNHKGVKYDVYQEKCYLVTIKYICLFSVTTKTGKSMYTYTYATYDIPVTHVAPKLPETC